MHGRRASRGGDQALSVLGQKRRFVGILLRHGAHLPIHRAMIVPGRGGRQGRWSAALVTKVPASS